MKLTTVKNGETISVMDLKEKTEEGYVPHLLEIQSEEDVGQIQTEIPSNV